MQACKLLLEDRELRTAAIFALWAAYAALEFWFGRTSKVKAGSLPEAIYNVIVKPKPQVFEFPTQPKEENENGKSI